MKRITALILIVAMVTMLAGCTGVNITEMTVTQESISMVIGDTFTPEIEFQFDNTEATQEQIDAAIEAAAITWTTSDEDVVKVIDGGVEAVGAGESEIVASDTTGNFKVTIGIVVTELATGIEVVEEIALIINSEETANVTAEVLPANAEGDVTYSSSDEDVATVSEEGEVTAIGNGEAVITVTLTVRGDEVAVKEVPVTVTTQATGVGLESTEGWIYSGSSYTIYPFAIPETASETSYTFESDDEDVATVSSRGTITGESVGTADITVTDEFGNSIVYTMTMRQYVAPQPTYSTSSGSSSSGGSTSSGTSSGGSSSGSYVAPSTPSAPAPAPSTPAPAPSTPATPPVHVETSPALTPGDGTNGGQWSGE